jgi:hypothetical protein
MALAGAGPRGGAAGRLCHFRGDPRGRGRAGRRAGQRVRHADLLRRPELSRRAVPGRADDPGRPGGLHRVSRALLEPGAGRPDGVGRHRRNRRVDVAGGPREPAPAADVRGRRGLRPAVGMGARVAQAETGRERDHLHADAELHGGQLPAAPGVRQLERPEGQLSVLAAVPRVRAAARARWRRGQRHLAGGHRRAAGVVAGEREPRGAVPALRRCEPARGACQRRAGAAHHLWGGAAVGRDGRAGGLRGGGGAGRAAHAGLLPGLRLLGHPHRLPGAQQPAGGHGGGAAGGGAVRDRAQPAGVLPGAVLDGAAHTGDHRGVRRVERLLHSPPAAPRGRGGSA